MTKEDVPNLPFVNHGRTTIYLTNKIFKLSKGDISFGLLQSYTNIDFFHNLPDEIENETKKDFSIIDWVVK